MKKINTKVIGIFGYPSSQVRLSDCLYFCVIMEGIMKYIKLTQGFYAKVSDMDFERVSRHKWCAARKRDQVVIAVRKNNITMHGYILNVKAGIFINHINQDTLDNTRGNLRIVTQSQVGMGRRVKHNSSSKYKGVSFSNCRDLWYATITKDGQHFFLGRFEKEIDAALAYNNAAIELFGEFARLNDLNLQINKNM